MSVFDEALEKRFNEAPLITAIEVTSNDTLLIRDLETGNLMRMPVSILYNALGSAFATLVDGKVPASQLPSYVDDVLEYANTGAFPATGESGKIYVALDTNKTYRWSGSSYVEISASLALGETSSTAYRGDLGKTAYDHSQNTGNPHGTTKADLGLANVSNDAQLKIASNLSDLNSASAARSNLGLQSAALQAYDESTYSPTWNGGSLTVNKAVITKIGRIVITQIDVLLGSSSASEECKITLPETPSAGFHIGIFNYSSYSTTITPNVDSGFGANVVFRSDQSSGNLTCSQLSGARLAFTVIYTK